MADDKKLTELTLVNIAQITALLYLVTFDADGVSTSVAMSLEDLQKSTITGVNRIISGQVVWTGTGFTHRSVQLAVEINGVIYYSDAEDITNSAPDGSNPRFDVIFFDADGLDIKEGTPAASPTVPSLDNPTSEVATNIVLVTNGETTPTGVTLETLYSENLQESGGEWDTAESTSGVRITLANTTLSSQVNRFVIAKGEHKQVVYYWFQQRGRTIASEYAVKWYMLLDSIRKNRTDGALVRLTTLVLPGEDIAKADERLVDFASQVQPFMPEYIPN